MNKQVQFFSSENAPKAIGPYSQAVEMNGFLFLSGQLGVDPMSAVLQEGIEKQVHQTFKNIQAVLKAAGRDLSHVVKATVFLKDMADFGTMNQIYEQYFGGHKPARSTIQVAKLPREASVEIEVIAY